MINAKVDPEHKSEEISNGAKDIISAYHLWFENEDFGEYQSDKIRFDEFTDDKLEELYIGYMSSPTLDDAIEYLYAFADTLIKDTYKEIDFNTPNYKDTPEYKQWCRHNDLSVRLSRLSDKLHFPFGWAWYNGKLRTFEDACTLAAEKWVELIFGWHLNDNGALNQSPSFHASLITSTMGNDIKEKIPDDVKNKAFELFKGFYKAVEYKDNQWLIDNIPSDKPDEFNWEFIPDLCCDYDPSRSLYLLLLNAGIDKNDIHWICPWKTHITIRNIDNAVIIHEYQKHNTY